MNEKRNLNKNMWYIVIDVNYKSYVVKWPSVIMIRVDSMDITSVPCIWVEIQRRSSFVYTEWPNFLWCTVCYRWASRPWTRNAEIISSLWLFKPHFLQVDFVELS